MNRNLALGFIRIDGYHNDQAHFMRTYVENRISYAAAIKAFREGAELKKRGARCSCPDCNREAK